ncbi:transcriptional regulator, partial [Streptococcus danieliae]|nr:transcriptional regulator [Streptococcus danieliae]
MVFNVKKEYKEFYPIKVEPRIVQVPKLNFLAVRGQGDPNEAGG